MNQNLGQRNGEGRVEYRLCLFRGQANANHGEDRGKYNVSRSKAGRDNENLAWAGKLRPRHTKRWNILPMTVPEEVSWQKDVQGLGWLRP